jgi:hypothetical protein
MDVKFCGQCGTQLKEDASFCPQCGWKVISIEDNNLNTTEEYKQSPIVRNSPQEYGHTPIAQETEEYHHTPIAQNVPEEYHHTPIAQNVPEEYHHTPIAQNVPEEYRHTPIAQKSVREYNHPPITQNTPSREFNPYHQNANAQSTIFHEENASSKRKLALIIGIGVTVVLLVIIIFLSIQLLNSGSPIGTIQKENIEDAGDASYQDDLEESSLDNNLAQENIVSGNKQSSEIDGKWNITATTNSVLIDGQMSTDYVNLIGQSSRSSIVFDTANNIAIMKEAYSGMEITLPLEYNGKEIIIGSETDENRMVYKGKLLEKDGSYIIEGEWETIESELNMEMSGTFTAVKPSNLLPQDVLDSAVLVSGEELQGIYKGTLRYSKIENIDQVPEAMMSAEEKQMMKNFIGVDYECTAEIDGEDIEITFIHPDFGESSMDMIELSEMQDGVISISEIEDEGTATMQIAVLGAEYDYSLIGAMEMKMQVPDGDDVVFLINFDVYYWGTLEE